MARWTNERWTSTLHRVVNPDDLGSLRSRRQTIGYFMHPDFDAIIDANPFVRVAERGAEAPPNLGRGSHRDEDRGELRRRLLPRTTRAGHRGLTRPPAGGSVSEFLNMARSTRGQVNP